MKRIIIYLIVPIFMLSCNQMKQQAVDEKSPFGLSWSFKGNNAEQGDYSAAFVLENRDETALTDLGWAIYFSQQGLGVIDESVSGNVRIEHLNGDFLKISPLEGFRLDPGTSLEISYRKPGSMFLHSEAGTMRQKGSRMKLSKSTTRYCLFLPWINSILRPLTLYFPMQHGSMKRTGPANFWMTRKPD